MRHWAVSRSSGKTSMIVKRRFSLDTNILVYAVDRDAGQRHESAKALIGMAAHHDCVLTTQALAEFYYATTRKGLLEQGSAGKFVRDWLEVFSVTSADERTLVDAMEVVHAHGLSFWDAMLWSAAKQAGCAAIFTEDLNDGQRIGGVEIINPFPEEAELRVSDYL